MLEFESTNNVTKYDDVLLGLELARDMGVKVLEVKGDSNLAVLQVKNM
jgi:ribonuclease HI